MKIPKGETLWVNYMSNGEITHIITSDIMRTNYYLYKFNDGELIKTKFKNKDPTQLEKYLKD